MKTFNSRNVTFAESSFPYKETQGEQMALWDEESSDEGLDEEAASGTNTVDDSFEQSESDYFESANEEEEQSDGGGSGEAESASDERRARFQANPVPIPENRRITRSMKQRMSANSVSSHESKVPETYQEAIASDDRQQWERAMDVEMMNHQTNGTWETILRTEVPKDKQVLKGRWVYALKKDQKGNITSHKARWVGKGFQQRPGRDFFDVSSPVMSVVTLRIIAALVANKRWKTKQGDFVAAYLNGAMDVDLYI